LLSSALENSQASLRKHAQEGGYTLLQAKGGKSYDPAEICGDRELL
jgi:hypothetical protein